MDLRSRRKLYSVSHPTPWMYGLERPVYPMLGDAVRFQKTQTAPQSTGHCVSTGKTPTSAPLCAGLCLSHLAKFELALETGGEKKFCSNPVLDLCIPHCSVTWTRNSQKHSRCASQPARRLVRMRQPPEVFLPLDCIEDQASSRPTVGR